MAVPGADSVSSSIAFGARARDLLSEMKGSATSLPSAIPTLPPYNDEAFKAVVAETHALAAEAEALLREDRGGVLRSAPFQVYSEAVARNRRALLAYAYVPYKYLHAGFACMRQ